MTSLAYLFIRAVTFLLLFSTSFVNADEVISSDRNEELLLSSLKSLNGNELDSALKDLQQLTDQRPDFRLAQLIYADVLAAQAQGSTLSNRDSSASDKKKIDALISEAKARLLVDTEKPNPNMVPADLLRLARNQRHSIIVDTRLSRLFLFENRNGIPVLIKDFYASYGRGGTGKKTRGDLKTPLGVYFTTGRLKDIDLPSKYGSGALPLNYPNIWDRRLGNSGSGIWLHGSPIETYSRPPLASEGCISLTNPDFITLDKFVDYRNTPVLVGYNIRWISKSDWLEQRRRFENLITRWVSDWNSLDYNRYIDNYSNQYQDGKRNYQQFSSYKARVNGAKAFIKVTLNNLSLYRYPDNPGLVVATFKQDYKSNNLNALSIKRQYWIFDKDRWRIAYEGKPGLGSP